MSFLKNDELTFFEVVREGFRRARDNAGDERKRFQLAGRAVELQFAGSSLPPVMLPALEHLEVAQADPDLKICVWDSSTTGTPLPLLARNLVESCHHRWWEWLDTRMEIKGVHGDEILATFHLGPGILSVFNPAEGTALYWLPDATQVPYWEKGSPFLTILSWWLPTFGCQLVHGAAVSNGSGAVLLPGRGGTGKSTTTLSCVGSDLGVLGDDYCILEDSETPTVHSLYGVAKLKGSQDLSRFPDLAGSVLNPDREDGEKILIRMSHRNGVRLIPRAPLKGILVPAIAGQLDSRVTPTSRSVALRGLAASTLLQLPGSGSAALRTMARLVRRLPVARLELGTDLSQLPTTIGDYLDGLGDPDD